LLGDLVFCPEIVAAEAAQQGKNIADHWTHLLLHGLFHLLGYDHLTEEDASEMEALEIRALESLGITNPYLLD
jgi:probable rRNA maturation factor